MGDASASGAGTIAPPGWGDAEAAAARLRQVFPPSPLLRAGPALADELLLKADTLLPTGSFKVRGIWDAVSQLSEERVVPGLSTVSAGNTALALAWAARRRRGPAVWRGPGAPPPAQKEGLPAARGAPRRG
ncbi:MAG: pyridoxal-phosphate dependent enzyme, partial [Acidobacteriota bacterium]|nr:pyridoxal-phosphate dependent enzyme [Acidobacteriota bacterium]